jgi:hypothetical protein
MLDIRLCKSRWSDARELIAAAHESNQPQWVVRDEVFLCSSSNARMLFSYLPFTHKSGWYPLIRSRVLLEIENIFDELL